MLDGRIQTAYAIIADHSFVQSTARSLRVQSQQLLMKSQVFKDEVLAGAESTEHPPEEMPARQDHGKNIIGKVRINHGAKSFILCMYDVLARYNATGRSRPKMRGVS
jgi:hypothetical protein